MTNSRIQKKLEPLRRCFLHLFSLLTWLVWGVDIAIWRLLLRPYLNDRNEHGVNTFIMAQKRSLVDSDVMSTEPKVAKLETCPTEHRSGSSAQLSANLKRGHDASTVSVLPKSKAAKFNAHTLRKLKAAIDKNPEVDLTAQMPINYSVRLVAYREEFQEQTNEAPGKPDGRTGSAQS